MSAPQVAEISEEQLQHDVPCGICGKPAVLRSLGHAYHPTSKGAYPPHFKCIPCYQSWLKDQIVSLVRYGRIRCRVCKEHFATVDDFAKYEAF